MSLKNSGSHSWSVLTMTEAQALFEPRNSATRTRKSSKPKLVALRDDAGAFVFTAVVPGRLLTTRKT